ncbi:MAG: glycosyltransferase [Vicinamibacterales bacterium]
MHGEHLLIEDDADRFADAVLELMGNRERSQALARSGRARMVERYRWDSVVETLERFYGQLIAAADRPAGPA